MSGKSTHLLHLLFSCIFINLLAREANAFGFGLGGGGSGGGCGCCGSCGSGCGCGGGGYGGGGGGYVGGCGGGCGGGCCQMTTCCQTTTCTTSSCGGGCGRRKRAVLEQQLKTEKSDACPQTGWKKIIDEKLNSDSDAVTAEYAIQAAMVREFEKAKFFVTCVDHTPTNQDYAKTKKIPLNKFDRHTTASTIRGEDDTDTIADQVEKQQPPSSVKFLAGGEAFCSHGNEKLWCTVVALMT